MKNPNAPLKLGLLSVAGCVLLNLPLLETVNKPLRLGGIPVLFLYVFGVWLLFLVAMVWILRKEQP